MGFQYDSITGNGGEKVPSPKSHHNTPPPSINSPLQFLEKKTCYVSGGKWKAGFSGRCESVTMQQRTSMAMEILMGNSLRGSSLHSHRSIKSPLSGGQSVRPCNAVQMGERYCKTSSWAEQTAFAGQPEQVGKATNVGAHPRFGILWVPDNVSGSRV